ncbi:MULTISPECIES: hypothetical protein [unclassified Leucobacter]|uniref:hypothetical protein n=1 Tax=unclassified Leucobacter TaxID=2621730 RepID=UPI001F145F0D|nr:hypothetical protein [Leucobacter sp. CX169]
MSAPKKAGWIVWTIGGLVTLMYGYAVVAAVGNLLGIPGIAAALGLGVSAAGWAWLSLGVALPVLVYVVALVISRRRPGWARILLLATGLCVVAVLQLDIMHVIPQSSFFA